MSVALAGEGAPSRRVGAWVQALRIRTLPAAVVPVAVGTAAAARADAADAPAALLALGVALAVQVGTNLVNDWGDFRRGADGPDRLGPRRVGAPGLLAPRDALAGGLVAFAIAAILGLVLVARAGLPALAIGAAAIAAGLAYTAGPFPLAYHGLGEAFVLVFFGPVAVCGTELVQAGGVSETAVWASLAVGLMATAIMLVNGVRDVDGDRRAGKRTLVVRLGRRTGRGLYVACVTLALVAPVVVLGVPAALAVALPAAMLAVAPLRAVLARTDGPALDAALAGTARVHLVFGLALAAALGW